MSNYLLVLGNEHSVGKVLDFFVKNYSADEEQISQHQLFSEKSILIIERRPDSLQSSIKIHDTGEGVFFRGQALDHETNSMILGLNGFSAFQKEHPQYLDPKKILDFEGTFISARWHQNEMTVETDLYSMYRLIFMKSEDIVIVSDSLVLIHDCMKLLGLPIEINQDVALIKAWNASGLPNCPLTSELIVKNTFTIQCGGRLEFSWTNDRIQSTILRRNVRDIFEIQNKSYNEILRDCIIRMYSTISFSAQTLDTAIEFGLSGGIDSRTLLSICLQSDELMDKLIINTNSLRLNDFEVVKSISDKFGFSYNDSNRKERILNNQTVKRYPIKNRLGFWKLASLGTYDSFYLTTHFYDCPSILSMVGVGAEAVKQTMDKSRVTNLARSQHPLIKSTVQSKISETIEEMGVDSTSDTAMKWFHLSYKSAYHLGYKIAQSSMLLRPFVQKNIFSLALASDNPYFGKANEGPTALHDMMILLNPELASMPYDTPKKNISRAYADNRLIDLGGKVDLTNLPRPKIFGKIEDIANGPAPCFLHIVDDFQWEDSISEREHLKNLVEFNFKNKIPDNLLEIYESCYENTISNLKNPKIELGAAGALAARFLAFDFFG
jgi:hypothetical protein